MSAKIKQMILMIVLMVVGCGVAAAHDASLKGSKASVNRMHRVAVEHDFTFLRTPAQIQRFVRLGFLVKLAGNANYILHRVSYPYVRPEVKLFVERLSRQYRSACGERLVVTSATRPKSYQPRNASTKSVHPTGMAVDFRRPGGHCRKWIEENLIAVETRGVAEATRERNPPHYHIAVFPRQYACYVKRRTGVGSCTHTVKEGETLSGIAFRHKTTTAKLVEANDLSSPDEIRVGQKLELE